MGFLNKIFNSSNQSSSADNSDNLITFYKAKYQKMEQKGCDIDWWAFQNSIDRGWPYPIATEAERDAIQRFDKQALRNHAIDISELLYKYSQGSLEQSNDSEVTIYKDNDKVKFWKQYLIHGAKQGNKTFQAALISEAGIHNGVFCGWETEDEQTYFRDLYEVQLIREAENVDSQAMYAVAEFCLKDAKYGSARRKLLAENAMKAGLGDAAFLCAEIYKSEISLNKKSWEYKIVLQYYYRGVECNNGAMLGSMQDCLADAYRDGEEGFPKDYDKAIYYYQLAAQNGSESAQSTLRLIEAHPDMFK